MKWSVVMISHLGAYPGSRSHPVAKFHRAIQSFKWQTHPDKELIIVSDGCRVTENEYRVRWGLDPEVKFVWTEKSQAVWPGAKRQVGVDQATGDWITYLDSDDIIMPDRLSTLSQYIDQDREAIIDNSYISPLYLGPWQDLSPNLIGWTAWKGGQYEVADLFGQMLVYSKKTNSGNICGTYGISHQVGISSSWQDSRERGEDSAFVKDVTGAHSFVKIESHTYINCHVPNRLDV